MSHKYQHQWLFVDWTLMFQVEFAFLAINRSRTIMDSAYKHDCVVICTHWSCFTVCSFQAVGRNTSRRQGTGQQMQIQTHTHKQTEIQDYLPSLYITLQQVTQWKNILEDSYYQQHSYALPRIQVNHQNPSS